MLTGPWGKNGNQNLLAITDYLSCDYIIMFVCFMCVT